MSIDVESEIYARAQHELESQSIDRGVWTKALVDADGDKERACLLYVKYRVIQWKEQTPSDPNASPVCHSSEICEKATPLPAISSQDEQEKIQHVLRSTPVEFLGSDAKKLTEGYCRIMKVRNLENVLIDLVITNRRVLVVPATKNHSDLQWLGLLLGGPLIGGAVSALSAAFIARHHDQSKRTVDVDENGVTDKMLADCAVWDRSSLKFEVFVENRCWTIVGSTWVTTSHISGPCQYCEETLDAVFEIPTDGKAGSTSWMNRPEVMEPIAKAFGYDLAKAQRR